MFPGMFLTPAVLPPGMFGVLFEPAAVLGPLAALVAGVAAGLSVVLLLPGALEDRKAGNGTFAASHPARGDGGSGSRRVAASSNLDDATMRGPGADTRPGPVVFSVALGSMHLPAVANWRLRRRPTENPRGYGPRPERNAWHAACETRGRR